MATRTARSGARTTGLLVALALSALAAAGCGADPSPGDARPAPKVTVVMSRGSYHPPHVRIEAGTRVTWFNRDMDSVTAETWGVGFFDVDRRDYGVKRRFDIHTIQRGEAESVLFQTPGTYRYHSSYDEDGMRGVVEVVPRKDG